LNWVSPRTSPTFDDDTHSLPSHLRIPIYQFPFGETRLLLHFWWYPFSTSLSMIPIYFFTFDDTRSFWWHPLDREVRIVGIYFLSQLPRDTECARWSDGCWRNISFLFITKDKTRIFVSFVFHKGFFLSGLQTLRTSFLMSWDN
jgi:hypothetical protein